MNARTNYARRQTCLTNSRVARGIRTSLTAAFLLAALIVPAYYMVSPAPVRAIGGNPSLGVVISQVYGGAGCGTAACSTYQNDFIELYNRSNTPISLNGFSVQYAAATGTSWQVTNLPNVTVQPGQYFLVAESFGANGVNPLPTPDATGTIAMSATAAKVAFVNCTTALTGACPSNVTGACSIIDFVGYGATANCNETANAPAPSTTTADIRNAGGNTDTDNNSTDFQALAPTPRNTSSPFGTPTVAKLVSFTAARYEAGVFLRWQTGFEVGNLGFNIYREVNGKRERVNPQMLAGSALMVGERTHLKAGHSYAWVDVAPASRDARYWLEAIDLNGQTEWHGPIAIDRSGPRAGGPPESGRASLLSNLGNATARSSSQVARTASAPLTTAAYLAAQSDLATRPGVKLSVNQEGWYRVTQPEMVAAGFDAAINPRQLRLLAEGQEQAILVRGEEDGRFDKQDAIEFYGLGLDTPSTDARTYWLVAGEQPGLRIKPSKQKGSRAAESGFAYTVERRDRTVYFSSLRNGEKENFFGAVIARNPVNQSLNVQHIDPRSTEDAVLEVSLQGVTAVGHRVAVRFNGSDLGEIAFSTMENRSEQFTVPRAAIREGENVVTLTNHETEGDVSLVESLRLTYRHAYTADVNALRFSATGKRVLTIDGFTSPNIRVVDVTDPAAPSEVKTSIEQLESGYSVRIKTPKGGERLLMAFTAEQIKHPISVLADQLSDLRNKSREADLVIVTRTNLIPAIEPLVLLRRSQGLSVAVVDVEDIYDEFNFGEKSAKSIKDFFAFAYSEWSKPPRFALIVGDASLDPKNYMGPGDFDVVPTRLVDTILMETASDEWLVDFDGDGLGELAVGRLPARTPDEAALMIGKTVAYESAAAPNGVLLVSDSNDGIDFESGTDRLRELVSEGVAVEEIVRGRLTDDATKSQVLDSVRRGKGIVSYFGHGSVDLWRGGILTSADVPGMSGSNGLPLFLSITCLNGYFLDPALDALAESLLKTQAGGAAAVWASSGMCGADEQLAMNLEMFRLMFRRGSNSGPLTLGEAVLKAKAATTEGDARQTYILFGDPSARLR